MIPHLLHQRRKWFHSKSVQHHQCIRSWNWRTERYNLASKRSPVNVGSSVTVDDEMTSFAVINCIRHNWLILSTHLSTIWTLHDGWRRDDVVRRKSNSRNYKLNLNVGSRQSFKLSMYFDLFNRTHMLQIEASQLHAAFIRRNSKTLDWDSSPKKNFRSLEFERLTRKKIRVCDNVLFRSILIVFYIRMIVPYICSFNQCALMIMKHILCIVNVFTLFHVLNHRYVLCIHEIYIWIYAIRKFFWKKGRNVT